MKKIMYEVSAISLALMFTFFGLLNGTGRKIFLTLGITALTVCYHFTIRLVIGNVVQIFKDRIDHTSGWFDPLSFEENLYKKIKLRRWKELLPTYDEEQYSLNAHSFEDIIKTTCRSEIVHEINVLASLTAMLFALFFGDFWVFCITSVLGAAFDLLFVAVQRYNRPRLIRAYRRKNNGNMLS